jgi:hypothetical protein
MNEVWNRRDNRVASVTRALAGPAGDAREDVLSEHGGGHCQDRGDDTAMEMAGLVVDGALRGRTVLGRAALRRLRRQRGAVLSELHRGPRRTVEGPGPPPAVRRPRSATLGRHGGIRPTPGRTRWWKESCRWPGRDKPVSFRLARFSPRNRSTFARVGCAHRRAQGGSPMRGSIRPTRATLQPATGNLGSEMRGPIVRR